MVRNLPEWRLDAIIGALVESLSKLAYSQDHLKTVVDDGGVFEEREGALRQICQQTRIQAECEVLIRQPSQSLNEVIVSHSRTADLVMLGMSLPDPEKTAEFVEWYDTLISLDLIMYSLFETQVHLRDN